MRIVYVCGHVRRVVVVAVGYRCFHNLTHSFDFILVFFLSVLAFRTAQHSTMQAHTAIGRFLAMNCDGKLGRLLFIRLIVGGVS